jgi:hypothetical protein
MNRVIAMLFGVGTIFFAIAIIYSQLAPSPVDVLVDDYKDGYGFSSGMPTSTLSQPTTTVPTSPPAHSSTPTL